MTTARSAKLFFILTLALALGTMVLYWPVATHPFIIFDDDDYIVENPHVVSGLNETNVIWAFDGAHAANWHPLTWVSHQADCSLFGTDAGGSHLVNLLFHVANTLLLFLFLSGTTGALWRSAVVAALFAWHPLHVESVAWAAERKDVLSAFFWLLTLLAYAGYARRAASGFRRAWPCYFAALCFFALGLMSKPMVVTLPFVLLLLDIWPLNRLVLAAGVYRRQMIRLLVEKIPFFLLSFAGCLGRVNTNA